MGLLSTTLFYHALEAVSIILVGALIALVLQQKRPPSASLAWIIFIIAMPYLAVPLYLTLGIRKLHHIEVLNKQRLFKPPSHPPQPVTQQTLDRLLDSFGIPPAMGGNRVRLHEDGSMARDALFELIERAEKQVDVCTFILADDAIGHSVMEGLKARAQQGLRVRVLIDGVGSFLLPDKAIHQMRAAGIEVARFIPVLHRPFKGRTNLRNHRKLIVSDSRHVWSGGRNIADEYFTHWRSGPPFVDLSFDLSGPSAQHYQYLFDADWDFSTNRNAPNRLIPARYPKEGEAVVRVIPSGPDIPDDPLHALLLSACFDAQQRISLITPYYVPDEAIQEALCLAARRGVSVTLILPERSNHRLADTARNRYLHELREAGAQIKLHPDRMIHAKAMVFDRQLALCGSANVDLRSLYLNFESMALFYHADEIDWLANWCATLEQQCHPFAEEKPGTLKQLIEGTVLLLAYQL